MQDWECRQVFAQTDIQPLLNQGANNEDICASIYQAVVNQTIAGLAQGRRIDGKVMFLGGPLSLVTIENENAKTDKELIIFRDSFGSSIAPLFVEGYKKITLVDIRYMHPNLLDNYIEFNSQDVLFLYSTSVLNNSETIK